MSLISFDAALQRGGPVQFRDLPEAILWAQQQSRAWAEKFRLTLANNRDSNLSAVRDYWNSLVDDLQSRRARGESAAVTFSDDSRMIIEESPVYVAMSWAFDNLTKDGMEAVGSSVGLGGRIDWSAPAQVSAIFSYERRLSNILQLKESEKHNKYKILSDNFSAIMEVNKKEMDNLYDRFSSLKDKGNELEALCIEQVNIYRGLAGSAESHINDKIIENNNNIEKEKEEIIFQIGKITEDAK